MTSPTAPRPAGAFADLTARVRAHAAREPGRVALTFRPAHLDGQRVELTYGQVAEESERMARRLAARLRPGDRALLLFPATPEFAVAFLGCLAAGVVAVPVPLPVDEAARRRVMAVARDCAPAVVISLSFIRDLAETSPDTRPLCEGYDWILADEDAGPAPARPDLLPVDPEDVAFLQYTSGSTRAPRGVRVAHGALLANEAAIHSSFQVSPASTIVSWLPLHHDMGLIGGLLQPLYAGARGVVLDPLHFVQRPASWLETISEERADISGGPNFAYELCVRRVTEAEKARLDLSHWRVAFNGAAQVFPRTLREFSAAFAVSGFRDAAHLPCYGLAEATLLVASAPADVPPTIRRFTTASLEAGEAEATDAPTAATRELVGYPLPEHTRVGIVDPATRRPLGEGRTGEVVVAGPSNGSGYWANERATEETFRSAAGEWLVHTGDLGFVLDGHLHVEGRAKDLVVHRGRNLHPEDLEADVAPADSDLRPGRGVVFGVPHDGDEAVVVCQEVRADTPEERLPEIAERVHRALARVHGVAAHRVVLLPPGTVTKTSSGKPERHAVRRRFLAGELPARHTRVHDPAPRRVPDLAERLTAGGALDGADRATAERRLTDALRDHLRESLGLSARPDGGESLAALGADSLAATRLRHDIERALGVTLNATATLRADSVAALAATALDRLTATPLTATPDPASAARPARPAPEDVHPLTAGQRALWFLQRADPSSTDYNVTRAFRLTGSVRPEVLATALDTVTRRHRTLRLSVNSSGGEPRATVREHGPRLVETDARGWSAEQQADWYRTFATTPFDLEHDPLVRATLLRRDSDWLLALSLHHLVCDVSSLTLLLAELAAACDPAAPAPAAPDPTVAPAALEEAVLAERRTELARFWQDQLSGELPVLALPRLGEPEPGPATPVTFTAEPELATALHRYARQAGLTPHNVLLAAFQVLLHRYSGQDDLLVGVPTTGRGDHRLRSWVGYLVNVVPVRSSLAGDGPFDAFAHATQRRVWDLLDHEELPLAEITRLVNPDRDSATAALFQAMFACYSTALPGGADAAAVVLGDRAARLPCGEGTLHGHPVPDYTAQAQLCLNVTVTDGGVGFAFQYDAERLTRRQVEGLADSYRVLLTALVDQPDQRVGEAPLLAEEEAAHLLASGAGPSTPRPSHYLDTLEAMVDERPDTPAVDDGVRVLTYAEVDQRANHLAARLRSLGVGVDSTVVVSSRRSVDLLVALLAVHKADGCYVPVSPSEAPRRAAAMVSALAPVVALADDAGRALLADLDTATAGPELLDLAESTREGSPHRPPRLSPRLGGSYIIHTSGSTGPPKAAVSTNSGLTNHLWQMLEYFGLDAADCVAQTGPLSFDVHLWQLLAPMLVGGRVRIVPEPDSLSPAGLLRATLDGRVTLLELVPSAVTALLDEGLSRDPGDLRIMIATAETLTTDVARRWQRELPDMPLYNAYGPTECTDDVSAGLSVWGRDAPITVAIGRALPNTSMYVLDSRLRPVPVGTVGSLYVGGAGVGRGYLGQPRRTAEVFVPDPFSSRPGATLYQTGDLARVNADGDVEFLGRADGQLKIRGLRIETAEVESALRDCAGIAGAAVKVHHGPAGAALVGYLVPAGATVPEDGSSPAPGRALDPFEDARLRGELAQRLPRHMIPPVLVTVPVLPRSGNGKVDYRALDYLPSGATAPDDGAAGDDPLAAAVRALWAEQLGCENVGWRDSFFELGGHSLVALTMIDRVARTVGVDLDVDAVFRHPRLCDFVQAVRRADPAAPETDRQPADGVDPAVPAGTDRAASAGPDRAGGRVPASTAQQRFWYLHELAPESAVYNMPGALRMRGELDVAALQAALRDALARHPVLLARFDDEDATLRWTPGRAEEFSLARVDLRGAVAEFGEAALDRLMAEEADTPIDPRREAPFRALLVRCGATDWALLVTIDHIVCDGWSLTVFLSDVTAAYDQRARGRVPRLAESRDFADFCRRERDWRQRHGAERIAKLWYGVGDRPLALSPLPTVSPPPTGAGAEVRSGGGRAGRFEARLPAELADAIRHVAGRCGTTPYLVVATAVAALTHSGAARRESVLLGTLLAQRDQPEWQRTVGPLLNVSLIAADLAPSDRAEEALHRVGEAALRAYRTRHVPFQDLDLPLPAAPGGDGSPFEVLLVMQPTARPELRLDGLTAELVDVEPASAPYPLTIDLEPDDGGYRVAYRYATDRHTPAGVADLAARLEATLRALVADADRPLGSLNATATAERS